MAMTRASSQSVGPRFSEHTSPRMTNVLLRLSQPWSKSSPSGVLDAVRRACLPSIASSDW